MTIQVDPHGLLLQFVEDLPDCALFVLDVEGKVLTWNTGARSIMGYLADEMVGQPFASLREATATAAEALIHALARGRHEEMVHVVRKDGRPVRAQSVLIPLYDGRERHVGFGNLIRELESMTAQVDPAVPAQHLATRRGSEQILVVDDDDEVRAAVVRQLTSLGYRVLAAASGAEALELLANVSDVDLLFVDVMMPNGMNGRECAERAKAMRPDLKLLFASGYFEGALVQRGDIEKSTDFLVKPYRKKELAEKVQQVLKAN